MLSSLLGRKFAFGIPCPIADRAASQAIGFCLKRLHFLPAFIQGEMRADNLTFTFAFPAAFALPAFCLAKPSVCGKLELDRMSTLGLLGIRGNSGLGPRLHRARIPRSSGHLPPPLRGRSAARSRVRPQRRGTRCRRTPLLPRPPADMRRPKRTAPHPRRCRRGRLNLCLCLCRGLCNRPATGFHCCCGGGGGPERYRLHLGSGPP